MTKHNFIDTDIFIHKLNPDPKLNLAAKTVFENNRPCAMSSFSLVELKGNYISDLILLHRKIFDSESLEVAYAKITRTGGRKSALMFAMLISWISNFSPHPWNEKKEELLSYLDGQISVAWESFKKNVDEIYDDIKCSRSTEAPEDDGEKWSATIPHCRKDNTKCIITSFIKQYNQELVSLINHVNNLDSHDRTQELLRIKNIAEISINNKFPWEGNTCRQVADLLIGLQSKVGHKLISSNFREHSQLHIPLNYQFEHFNLVKERTQ